MRIPLGAVLAAISFLLIGSAEATTLHVRQDGSGDFLTIGAAVAASSVGDVIEVGPGVYHERVDVYQRLTFVSTDGAAATVMDGDGIQHPLWFWGGVGNSVEGFTFRNGYNLSGGGAVRCWGGVTLTIRNCIFESNSSGYDGGALFTRDPGAFIDAYDCVFRNNNAVRNAAAGIAILGSRINYTRCSFIGNTCGELSGGVTCDRSSMDVRDCLFVDNVSAATVAAIYYHLGSGLVQGNTLYSNTSAFHGSILIQESPGTNVTRNIIMGDEGAAGLAYYSSTGIHSCNVFFGNVGGAISGAVLDVSERNSDPLFCDALNGDFTIANQSPAAPAQSPCAQLIGAFPTNCDYTPPVPTTRRVRQDGSGDYTTIGAAVAASNAGDVIEVGPGVYHETVDVYQTLSFVSTGGADATIIDGDGSKHPLWFRGGTGHAVDSFTFRNGYNASGGGAVRCMGGATLIVRNSVFDSNTSGYDGGALFTRDPGAFIDAYDCVFRNNHAARNAGAGIAILGSRINYTRCRFTGNACDQLSGAITSDASSMDVTDCLFVDNVSALASACIYYDEYSHGTARNNTLYSNRSGGHASILIQESPEAVVRQNIIVGDEHGAGLEFYYGSGIHECNVFFANAGGAILGGSLSPTDIEADPLFCDAEGGDFTIPSSSPAAQANSPCGLLIGAFPAVCAPIAVAIASFTADVEEFSVHLRGEFRSELIVNAVNVYRAAGGAGSFARIDAITGITDGTFDYMDKGVEPGRDYRYQIGAVDADGEYLSPIVSVTLGERKAGLEQNRPNPFNPTTSLRFTLPAREEVLLVVYDAAGRVVRTLVREARESGIHEVTWDGRDDNGTLVASGLYFYRIQAGKFTQTRKMVLLK